MSTSVLTTIPWWRELLDKLGRQAVQTAYPILGAVVASGGQIDVLVVLVGLAGALAVSLGKAGLLWVVELQVTEGSPLAWRLLDRAVPAAAGVLLGLWPAEWAGLLAVDWQAAVVAAVAAALLAVVGYWGTPPAQALGGGRRPARRGDRGAARSTVTMAIMVTLVGLGLVILATGALGQAQAKAVERITAVPHLAVHSATYCAETGVITVRHSGEVAILDGTPIDLDRVTDGAQHLHDGSTTAAWAWTFRKPSGPVVVELHHVGNGSGDGGSWDPIPADQVRQVESEAYADLTGHPTYDLVRVVATVDGIGPVASDSSLITAGCTR